MRSASEPKGNVDPSIPALLNCMAPSLFVSNETCRGPTLRFRARLYIVIGLFTSCIPGLSQGIAPAGVHQYFDVDTIDVKVGRALVQIPIASFPQRGQLGNLDLILLANGISWTVSTSCYNDPPSPGQTPQCTHQYMAEGGPDPAPDLKQLFSYAPETVDLGSID